MERGSAFRSTHPEEYTRTATVTNPWVQSISSRIILKEKGGAYLGAGGWGGWPLAPTVSHQQDNQ